MRRFALMLLAALAVLALGTGSARAQEPDIEYHTPRFLFDDAGFDYYANRAAWIDMWRDLRSNVVHVRLDALPSDGAVRFVYAPAALPDQGTVDHADLHRYLGIDVSDRSIEFPFSAADHPVDALIAKFTKRIPELGFVAGAEMFAGENYVFSCACGRFERTGMRLTVTPVGDTNFVRLTQYVPIAYPSMQ